MTREGAFWDASAIVPLCVDQYTSSAAHKFIDKFDIFVWWGTRVEVSSAIARIHRMGAIDQLNRRIAADRLERLRQQWDEILPGDELRDQACLLLNTYPLRAADSLQLAAAMIWCRRKPAGRTFIASDTRLGEAATHAGFKILIPGVDIS